MGSDPRVWFGVGGLFVGVFGVATLFLPLFPLGVVNLVFFTTLLLLAALYRPNWCFLLLVAVIPFETISILPAEFGFSLRPYQWVFVVLALALFIRVLSQRTPWRLFQHTQLDFWLALIPIGAFISGFASGGEGVRLAAIVASFYALYLLGRVFLKTAGDVRIAFITLFASGFVSLSFGILQNIAFEQGRLLQVVMPGRPNGTFAEPDWLGLFAVLLLVLAFSSLYRMLKGGSGDVFTAAPLQMLWQTLLLILVTIGLILTVSRSAWLAAFVAISVWVGVTLFAEGKRALRHILQSVQVLVIACIIALVIVVDVPLTRFDLLNRAESTATGLQEITVACDTVTELPEKIGSVDDLSAFQCRHINLEERSMLAAAGYSIQTIKRPDPNVVIRSDIYRKTWDEILAHPVLGIGWGNIGTVLGRDANGAAYNASNVWLELFLGAGLIGFLGLAGAFVFIGYRSLRVLFFEHGLDQVRSHLPLILSLLTAFLVFNLFNAGLLIGFVWISLAAVPALLLSRESQKL